MSSRIPLHVGLKLPPWTSRAVARWPLRLPRDPEKLMVYAVELLNEHIDRKTGGPFAALLVSKRSRRLMSVGLNQVVSSNDPIAHAECSAFRFAAQRMKVYQFSGDAILVSTSQMCGMCLSAAVWAGVGEVIIGASAADTLRIAGFDEGIIAPNWKSQLRRRGISVTTGVLRQDVCDAMRRYVQSGGIIYNGRRAG